MNALTLAALIDAHSARLALFARQYGGAADDVVQDAFLSLVRQKPRPTDPVAWLYRAVRNRAIDAVRVGRRRERRERETARPEAWFAESSVDGLEAAEAVAALECLPAEQREVIVARLWGRLGFEQIADVAGCSVSSAHRRFTAGIEALRRRLGATCPTT